MAKKTFLEKGAEATRGFAEVTRGLFPFPTGALPDVDRLPRRKPEVEDQIIVPLWVLRTVEAELEKSLRSLVYFGPNVDTQKMALDALKIKDVSISNSLKLLREITGKYD